MQAIPVDAVAKLTRLLAHAADPTASMTLAERRKAVVAGVGTLIQTDFWSWCFGVCNPEDDGDAMISNFVDEGFNSDEERSTFFQFCLTPDLARLVNEPLIAAVSKFESITRLRSELVDERQSPACNLMRKWEDAGFGDFIISAYPVRGKGHSGIGYHRRRGRPKFSESDRLLVSMAFEQTHWLHDSQTPVETAKRTLQLSPRERQVVALLTKGASQKQVARSLKLSEHTVTDYVKSLYRKFGVKSRAELLARFLASEAEI